jgi:hypothetical protein
MAGRNKFRCERIRQNNGVTEVFFTKDDGIQDEHILINMMIDPDKYEEGKYYWWYSEPAFPH